MSLQASILFVSSILAYVPKPPLSAYAISKTALLGAVKALAQELGPEGIRVNGIAPGIVPTKFSSALVASDDLRKQQVRARQSPGSDIAISPRVCVYACLIVPLPAQLEPSLPAVVDRTSTAGLYS